MSILNRSMLRPGQLVYSKRALEGWVKRSQVLEEGQIVSPRDSLLEPGEIVEITTWVMIPAWTPLVVTGLSTVMGGKEYYVVLRSSPGELRDSRSHYSNSTVRSDIVYLPAADMEWGTI